MKPRKSSFAFDPVMKHIEGLARGQYFLAQAMTNIRRGAYVARTLGGVCAVPLRQREPWPSALVMVGVALHAARKGAEIAISFTGPTPSIGDDGGPK